MIKIYKFYIYILLLFLLGMNGIRAEKINHVYDEKKDIAVPFLLQYDTESGEYELGLRVYHDYQKKENKEYVEIEEDSYELGLYKEGGSFVGGHNYHLYLNDKNSKPIAEGESLRIYYCITDYYGAEPNGTGIAEVYIFSDSLQRADMENNNSLPKKINSCKNLDSDSVKSGESESVSYCNTSDHYKDKIENSFKKYKKNKNVSDLIEGNKNIDTLKSVCNTLAKYIDYGDNCLNVCLDFPSWLKKIKVKYDISFYGNGVCGFSEKLIIYIANIVKWIKYIVPVIVIVFGIIDFIQAIASDKDDEMKKAQGRFIKRLIAAALVFIIPIIIEFALNVMGFEANGCGIIDL